MAKGRAQRIGIWIIAIVMAVGTVGSFIVIVLANDNAKIDQAKQQADYQKQLEAYTASQKEAQKKNAENSEALEGYNAQTFDATAVTALNIETLVEGDGDVVKESDSVNVSYFGWLSDGTIFDSSNKKDADDAPISFGLSEVIKGWTQGLTGVKVGSTIRLTIPAELAYNTSESGIIPANSPLQFIIIVHKIETATTN